METRAFFVEFYRDDHGSYPFEEWLVRLAAPTRVRISKRILRLRDGLFGDIEPIGDGLSELREHFGPGYRIYIGIRGNHILVLLGSDKSGQKLLSLQKTYGKYGKPKFRKTTND